MAHTTNLLPFPHSPQTTITNFKRNRELEQLEKAKIYPYTVLRLSLPDRAVVRTSYPTLLYRTYLPTYPPTQPTPLSSILLYPPIPILPTYLP